jgi:hypothetical protein
MSTTVALKEALSSRIVASEYKAVASVVLETMLGRGWNQLLLKSKKQRSDQLHEVKNRMSRRMEQ